jgi:hypothetical protein
LLFNLPEQDIGIMILDGFNGGGVPREINFGPLDRIITAGDAEEAADCEGRTGESVIVLGYGFY